MLGDSEYYHHLREAVRGLLVGSGKMAKKLQNVLVSHLIIFPTQNCTEGAGFRIREAVRLSTCKDSPWPLMSPMEYTLLTGHWREHKRIAALVFEAYEIAAADYARRNPDALNGDEPEE